MKNFHRLIFAILCCILLGTTVFAQNCATNVENFTTVSYDGSCQVSLDVTIRLDSPVSELAFPLPAGAKDVTMNGRSVRTYRDREAGDVVMVDLEVPNGMMGEYRVNLHYVLRDLVTAEEKKPGEKKRGEKKLFLQIPLLAGFAYPVEAMNFNITLPKDTENQPSFYSGYLQQSVESGLESLTGGNMISGSTTRTLNDHETLLLKLEVPKEMFPGTYISTREGNPEVIHMGICAGLALLYWIVTMRSLPIIRRHRTIPLEGVTAGEMGARLTTAGGDLTMMVFTWAQLGYLQIHTDKRGKILLEKRMDMGNERGPYENRCFQNLFGRRPMVDATGTHYAKICRKAAATVPGIQEVYRHNSGNTKLFRILATGTSLFGGICFAMNIAKSPTMQVILSILFGAVGVVTAWNIQSAMTRLHIRGKIPVYVGGACLAVWILIGFWAGQFVMALLSGAGQLLAGLLMAYGGRRSELGRYSASQVLGLRHYLGHVSNAELRQAVDANPEYFFDMLPYAIALGVDKKFAKQYGRIPLPECPYVSSERTVKQTPENWDRFLRKTADRMDRRYRRMQLERWIPITFRRY